MPQIIRRYLHIYENAADETPRLINKFCNISLLIGDSHKADLITTDIIIQAISDCELG